jgi:hypothetical protein
MREKRKEKDLESTLKFWLRHQWYHTKDLNDTNPTTLKKINNNEQGRSYSLSKSEWAITIRGEREGGSEKERVPKGTKKL